MECRRRRHQSHNPSANARRRRARQVDRVTHTFKCNEQALFDKECKIYTIVLQLPSLKHSAPQLVHEDRQSFTLILDYPRLHWLTLRKRAQKFNLDINTLGSLKSMLCKYVDELYRHNVAYRVKEDTLFLVKRLSGWDFFLGGWQNCTLRDQTETSAWNKQMQAQHDEINRLFEPLEKQSLSVSGHEHNNGGSVGD